MQSSLPTLLTRAGVLDEQQIKWLQRQAPQNLLSIPALLVTHELLSSQQLQQHISELFTVPTIDIDQYDYQDLCHTLGLRELVIHHQALPIRINDESLLLAVADPSVHSVIEDFSFACRRQIQVQVADVLQLQKAITQLYGKSEPVHTSYNEQSKHSFYRRDIRESDLDPLSEADHLLDSELNDSRDDSPVARFIEQILREAIRKQASDIHFEPFENTYRIRLRCDGALVACQQPSAHLSRRLACRIKILAQLDIAERRLPQDGRIKLKLSDDNAVDMRVSTLPTLWGEKLVLRLLDARQTPLQISELGYTKTQQQDYIQALNKSQGLILITGPTGSGKTTSLYAGLNYLNTPNRNIATAEDPVEIYLPGVNQLQIKHKIGLDFACALRAFLRQDPDIIMVGEIRDLDTAEIAIKAAQTGHLVLSTLHTNSAADTIFRLQHMGIAPFHLASALSLIVAQRLVRRLCPHCRQTDTTHYSFSTARLYKAQSAGCSHCNNGYKGRTGIYEMLNVDTDISKHLLTLKSARELEKLARSLGMQTLKQSAIQALEQGLTSVDELQRIVDLARD